MTAYEELKAGRNPRKLYVFFKEPGDITPELQSFKESFATEFGHFYCKFENVDSMRLHFLLQLEAYQNSEMKDLLKVEDSKVKVDGQAVINLDNIPFAAKNRRYRELKDEIERIESEIRTFEGVLAAGPNEVISDLLGKKRSEIYYKKEELSEHENFLFDTAVRIAQQQGDRISERMARAIQAFEDGRAGDANAILEEALHDAKELRRDIAKTKELLKQQQENAAVSISELLLKASVTLADDSRPVDDRIKETHEIYREAYALANESDYDREKYMELLSKYSDFLFFNAKYEECLNVDDELLRIKSSLYGDAHPDIAQQFSRIGWTYLKLYDDNKSLEYFNKALCVRLSIFDATHPDIARNYNAIGVAYMCQYEPECALEYYEKSLNIWQLTSGRNELDISETYSNIADVHCMQCDDGVNKALEYYKKSLNVKLSLFGENHLSVACDYKRIGKFYTDFRADCKKGLEYYEKALKIELSILGENHLAIADAYQRIGLLYEDEEPNIALSYLNKYLKISLSVYGENHITVANAYKVIGSIYESPLCDYDKALKYYEKHLEISVSVCGENDSDIASRCYEVGIFCYLHKKYDKAVECFVNSLNIQLLLVRNENFIRETTYSNIGEAYEFLGKYNKALEYYSKELNLRLRLLGDNHPDTKLIRDKIEIIRGETESI